MKIIETSLEWAYPLTKRRKTNYIVLHHEAGTGTAEDIHRYHLMLGWAGIAYHLYIRRDGRIFQGRPIDAVGGHTNGYNSSSIGICFEGNFENEMMSPEQFDAGVDAIEYASELYPGAKIVRHKDLNATACPGKNFPFEEMTEENMTQEKFSEMYEAMLSQVREKEESAWSDKEGWWDKATAKGIVNGQAARAPITREELIAVLGRIGLI